MIVSRVDWQIQKLLSPIMTIQTEKMQQNFKSINLRKKTCCNFQTKEFYFTTGKENTLNTCLYTIVSELYVSECYIKICIRANQVHLLFYLQPVKYPKAVGFIISNEFCERFNYYGMRSKYIWSDLKFPYTFNAYQSEIFVSFVFFSSNLGLIFDQ